FESPSSAVSCAIAAQQALNSSQLSILNPDETGPYGSRLQVRMALDTGEVRLEGGEYQGPTLHRTPRILAAAHCGQIVASEAVVSIVRRDLQPGVRLVDLGVYRLRDVQVPERLFQVN